MSFPANEQNPEDLRYNSEKPAFEIDTNGTSDSIRDDLETAGYPGIETTQTQENGTLHEGVQGNEGEMDVRVMNGQSRGDEFKGLRVITSRAGTNDAVRTDGSKCRNNKSKAQRQQESHVHLNQ